MGSVLTGEQYFGHLEKQAKIARGARGANRGSFNKAKVKQDSICKMPSGSSYTQFYCAVDGCVLNESRGTSFMSNNK